MKFGIIGNDQIVLSCIDILTKIPDAEITFVLYDVARLKTANPIGSFCDKNAIRHKGINKLNTPENYNFIKENKPDYLLSINNFFVIREDILSIPVKGTVNFHNSVPSGYHGLNIPSWVIINGEENHGAMWHFVERTIDTGQVIVFREFPVTKGETAASLMVKCIKNGIELFPELIKQLLDDNVTRIPQLKNSSYYGKNDLPVNKGYIDFKQNGREIDQLVRGLNYLPYNNSYLYAKIKNKDKEIIINSVEIETLNRTTVPGKIILINENSFHVECKDALVCVTDAMDESLDEYEGQAIADYLDVKINDTL
jgi:methionyl-tRNA formyltransferase